MSIKPILFNTEMVRAILDGRKTVTRRVVMDYDKYERLLGIELKFPMQVYKAFNSPCEPGDILWVRETWRVGAWDIPHQMIAFDYADGTCGQLVYIANREMFMRLVDQSREDARKAKCVYNGVDFVWEKGKSPCRWRPSIHMPREAARIWLRVTDVRVDRLQEITMQDISREGSVPSCVMCSFNEAKSAHGIKCRKAIERSSDCALENQFSDCSFRGLWDSTIKPADRERYGWAANPWVWVIEFEKCKKPEEG